MDQIEDKVYYDSSNDEDNQNYDNAFHDTIQEDFFDAEANDADDNIYGKPINNEFLPSINE